MKKIVSILLAVTAALLLFSSCNKKYDEIYNPKSRFSKIWFRSEVGDPDQVFTYNDKKLITRIHNPKDDTYFNFEYNGKEKKVSKITHMNDHGMAESIQLEYDDKDFVSRLEYTIDGALRQTITFTRRNNHTPASMTAEYDKEFFANLDEIRSSSFYQTFVGMDESVVKELAKMESKDLVFKSLTLLYFDEEKHNVTKTVTTLPEYHFVITRNYNYDENLNPYFELPFAYGDVLSFSKNNKIHEKITTTQYGTISTTVDIQYSYEYNEKKFPRRIITRSSETHNVPVNTYILYVKEK